MAAVQISQLTDANFQAANLNVLLWSSMGPNITIIIASIPTLRLLRASSSRGNGNGSSRGHQKLFSRDGRDRIRIVRTDDSRASPMTVGAPIFRQQTGGAAGSTATMATTTAAAAGAGAAPPRPPRPTSNQSFWTDSSSILKGGDNTTNPGGSSRALAHEASTEDLIQQSPVYSPNSHGPYSPGDINNNTNSNNNMMNGGGLGVPDGGRDTLKPSTNGKRLTPLEEESSLRGSSVSNNINTYNSNFDSYYNGGSNANNNNNYRSSSKYSTGAFIDTYGAQAQNVVEGMELIVPLNQQQGQGQRQQQQQQQQQAQYSPQYPQYPQQYGYSQNHNQNQNYNQGYARQQSPQHRRKPSVAEAPMYMVPVTATGGYGGML